MCISFINTIWFNNNLITRSSLYSESATDFRFGGVSAQTLDKDEYLYFYESFCDDLFSLEEYWCKLEDKGMEWIGYSTGAAMCSLMAFTDFVEI